MDAQEQKLKENGIEITAQSRGFTGGLTIFIAVLSGVVGGFLSAIGKEVWELLKNVISKKIVELREKRLSNLNKPIGGREGFFAVTKIHDVPIIYYVYGTDFDKKLEVNYQSLREAELEIELLAQEGKLDINQYFGINLSNVGKGAYLKAFLKSTPSLDTFLGEMIKDISRRDDKEYASCHHLKAGLLFGEIKEYELSEKHFRIALSENPSDPKTYIDIGSAQALRGEFNLGRETLIKGARIDCRYDQLHYNLAWTYALENDVTNVAEELEIAVQCGWQDIEWITNNSDFVGVLGDKRIQEIIMNIRKNMGK